MPKMDGRELLDRIKKEDGKIRTASNYKNIAENSRNKLLFIPKPISILI
jgi:CheY-like chemotaxis protein